MKTLRLLLYFVFGLCLGAYAVAANAETIPATPVQGAEVTEGVMYLHYTSPPAIEPQTTAAAAARLLCNAYKGPQFPVVFTGYNAYGQRWLCGEAQGITVRPVCPAGSSRVDGKCIATTTTYTCPDSSWTIDGQTCTKVNNCPHSGTGTGNNEKNDISPEFKNLYGWYDAAAKRQNGGAGTFCMAGCTVSHNGTICVKSTTSAKNNCAAYDTTYTGATCTGTGAPSVTSTNDSKPPCAQGEGVVTMGGQIACVPNGVSTDTPKVTTGSGTKTYPDGSTKTTNITTTCSGTGACSTTTTITNTGATSGSNAGGAGEAGEPGTTTEEGDTTGDKDSICAANPNLQICKGGMSEEGTQKDVLTEIKKLTTAPTDTNFADGDDYDQPLEGVDPDAAQKLTDSYKSTTDALKVGFDDQNAPKAEPKFYEILGNWFDDVPQTGCEPPAFSVAGHSLDLAAWCPTAEKISNIGAYALWFMTLVGLFVMVTGGKGST